MEVAFENAYILICEGKISSKKGCTQRRARTSALNQAFQFVFRVKALHRARRIVPVVSNPIAESLPCNMLLPSLCPQITVIFSTPTPDNSNLHCRTFPY